MSWISLEDAVKAICFILRHPEIRGPVNLVADFVPQLEFAEALASALHRPCLLPAPSFALRMALGTEMAQNLVLVNHRIRAKRLRDAGFEFGDVNIGAVLTSLYSEVDDASATSNVGEVPSASKDDDTSRRLSALGLDA
jgi:hypothetical protein